MCWRMYVCVTAVLRTLITQGPNEGAQEQIKVFREETKAISLRIFTQVKRNTSRTEEMYLKTLHVN